MSTSKNVWVLTEHREDQIETASLETLSAGRQLADALKGKLAALVAGCESRELTTQLASYGADEVLFLASPLPADYEAELYTEALARLVTDENPGVFLCAATLMGRDLSPRLAARLGTGLVAECTALSISPEGQLSGTRLTHGGKLSSTIMGPASGIQMATVKPGIISTGHPNNARQAEIKVVKVPEAGESRLQLKGVARAAPDKISIDEADIIVAAGKGVGGLENLDLLEELARRLGGVVAGSLSAVDEGWLTRKKLVGQTGITVTPQLYIACGISGSVYHVLGMKDSGFVIAINKDRGAPIFKVADMSIVGDVKEIVSAIITQLPPQEDKIVNSSEAGNAGKV